MSIELLTSFIAGISPLKVDSSLCSRLITPRSTCRRCLEVCPSKCISFNSDNIEIGQCNYCGLCVTNCPNHVFSLDEGILINNSLPDAPLIISCPVCLDICRGSDKSAVTKINCLGQLYPELLSRLLAGSRCVVLLIDGARCAECLGFDPGLLQSNLTAFTKFFDNLGQLHIVSSSEELIPFLAQSGHQKTLGLERRLFFKAIWTGAQNLPKKVLSSALEKLELEGEDRAAGSPDVTSLDPAESPAVRSSSPIKRKHLLEAFRGRELQNNHLALPYRKLNSAGCSFCEACTRLCPTKALKIDLDGDAKQMGFIPGRCTECGICLDICVFHSLSWSVNITAAEFLNQDPVPIASAQKRVCTQCQQEFWLAETGDSKLCSWCLRRTMNKEEGVS